MYGLKPADITQTLVKEPPQQIRHAIDGSWCFNALSA